jgi:hypothetical protein
MWDWIGLANDRNRWRALVNLVLNLHEMLGRERRLYTNRNKRFNMKCKQEEKANCIGFSEYFVQ